MNTSNDSEGVPLVVGLGCLVAGMAAILIAASLLPGLAMNLIYSSAAHGKTVTAGRDDCDTVAVSVSRTEGVFGIRHPFIARDSGEWAPESGLPAVDLVVPAALSGVSSLTLEYDPTSATTPSEPDCSRAVDRHWYCSTPFPTGRSELVIHFDEATSDPSLRVQSIAHYIRENMMCVPNTPVAD